MEGKRIKKKKRKYNRLKNLVATVAFSSLSLLSPGKIAHAEDAQSESIREGTTPQRQTENPGDDAPLETRSVSNIDIGARVFTTESGSSSFFIDFDYDDWLNLRGGIMWFPSNVTEEMDFSPFASLQVTPRYQSPQGIVLASYSSISSSYNLNSYLFGAQTFGIGYERKSGEFVSRGGVLWGGGISYPNFDYIFSDLRLGVSFEWNEQVLVYGSMGFFFAADSPAQTAYVGYYEPRFQNLMAGLEVRHNSWVFDLNGSYDIIRSEFNATVQRELYFGQRVHGRVWGTLGFGKWDDSLVSRRWELVALAGVELWVPSERINSTNRIEFEHEHSGEISQADMDINNPFIDRTYLEPWSENVESELMTSRSIRDFSERYNGVSTERLLDVARIMTHRARYLYAHSAMDALVGMQFFDSEVQRIAGMGYDETLSYVGAFLRYYTENGTLRGMPEYLQQGLGICTIIHDFGAEFLRLNGIHAITTSVNSSSAPHMILIAMMDDQTMLIDYGNAYITGPRSFDGSLRLYGLSKGAPVFLTQIFERQYLGTFITSEGRMVMNSMLFDNQRILGGDFLGRSVGGR